jgi:hypothetical protein
MSFHRFRVLVVLPLISLWSVLSGCKQETKFNRDHWAIRDDVGGFPHREQMLDDLVKHHQLKELTYKQLLDSLGEPSNYDEPDGRIRYLIAEDFESDIDPVHGKTLDLTLGPDSVVTSYKVSEW